MSTLPTLRGNDEPLLQKRDWQNEWTRGTTYGEDWKGINPAKMFAKWNGLVYTAQRMQMSVERGIASLRVEWSGSGGGAVGSGGNNNSIEVTIDRWECPEPTILVHVFEHPTFLAAMDVALAAWGFSVNDSERAQTIAGWIASANSGRQFTEFVKGTGWPAFVASHPTEASYMARMYQKAAIGQQWQTSLYSCRHTTNAPSFWGLNVADLNVNSIYSPAQFMSEATNASSWIYPLPGRLQYKLAAAASAYTALTPARSNYQIGWLKAASAESTAPRGRIEISTNYVLNQWSTDLYPTAV